MLNKFVSEARVKQKRPSRRCVIEFSPKASKVETRSISTWAMAVDSKAAAQLEESIMKKKQKFLYKWMNVWRVGEENEKFSCFAPSSPPSSPPHRTRVRTHSTGINENKINRKFHFYYAAHLWFYS